MNSWCIRIFHTFGANLLKQRADEIPKLIKVVKQSMKYEQEVLKKLTALRTEYLTAERIEDKVKIGNEVTFSIVTLALILSCIGKIMFRSFFDKVVFIVVITSFPTWLTGFISMIIFLFAGISAIKMLLIWITLFICYLLLSIVNRKELECLVLEFGNKKNAEK